MLQHKGKGLSSRGVCVFDKVNQELEVLVANRVGEIRLS